MTEILNLIFNVFISFLLVLTVAYCWVLNRRIRVLQDSRSELAQLIKHFDESTERASNSIVQLQSASKKIGEVIQERVEKANFMADDLAFLIEKATKSADMIEGQLNEYRAQRKQVAEESSMRRQPAPRNLHQAANQSQREPVREFTPAARGGNVPRPGEPVIPAQPERAMASATPNETLAAIQRASGEAAPEKELPKTRTGANLEALLQRMADRKEDAENNVATAANDTPARLTPARKPVPLAGDDPNRPRSRAEQELLDIIKAGSRV